MSERKKILLLSDTPLCHSGVGTQARYMIDGLIKTGKYKFVCMGGAIKHPHNNPINFMPELYDGNFLVFPVQGHGDKPTLRAFLDREKPDAVMLFTDPRFFIWVWEMEDEVRSVCPLLYNHVWDNDPTPEYNSIFYNSTDGIGCISLKTYGLLQDLKHKNFEYIPHALPDDTFKPISQEEIDKFKIQHFGPHKDKKFVVFWNNRNARRKQTGDVIETFSKFAKKVGKENVVLVMHTNPLDQEGQNVDAVAKKFQIDSNLIISDKPIEANVLNMFYNVADVTINIACFTAGNWVTTKNGYKKIEDIEIGEEVLTHKGRYKKVINTYSGRNSDNLIKIRSTGCNDITATNEHKIFAIKKNKVNFLINENIDKLRELAEKIPANQLEVGDYLVSTKCITGELINDVKLNVWKHAKDKVFSLRGGHIHNVYSLVENKIFHNTGGQAGKFAAFKDLKLDKDLAYIFGEWVADGSTNSCDVSFNKKDIDKAEVLRKKYERVFGNTSYIRESEKHIDVCLKNPGVYSKFLAEHCGEYSRGKKVPDVILQSKDEIKMAFIDGYLAGDGCVLIHPTQKIKKNRVRTVSAELASGVRQMLVSLGYCPSVRNEINEGSYKPGSRIWTVEWRDSKRKNNGSCRSWNDGNGVITRIFDIQNIELKEPVEVYNLEVEEDNTYVVENITVSNSNEGFGLGTVESLYAGTPIIVHMTGGLQWQIGNWYEGFKDFTNQDKLTKAAKEKWKRKEGDWFGVPIFSSSRSCVGSQQIPYIYDDRVCHDDVVDGFVHLYKMKKSERKQMGLKAREWALKTFNMERMIGSWDKLLEKTIGEFEKVSYRTGVI